MTNRFVQAPHHGGSFRAGQPTIIVIHSLEAPARRGLAYDLATGWIQNEEVSPHSMTDPGETVDLLSLDTIGWQCGNGNQVSIGLEVTGYAAWDFATWTSPEPFAAVRLDAKRAAEVAARFGIPIRWLSLQQIRNGESGLCTHADISLTLGGTNHTDPGSGFPFAIFLQMVHQWAGTGSAGSNPPQVSPGGTGGAQGKTPEQLEEEELMGAKDDIIAKIDALSKRLDAVQAAIPGAVWGETLKSPLGSQRQLRAREWLFEIRQKTDEISGLEGAIINTDRAILSAVKAPPVPPVVVPPVVVVNQPPAVNVYVVVAGDGFDAIAAKLKTTPDKLAAANPKVKDRNALQIGQALNIPKA